MKRILVATAALGAFAVGGSAHAGSFSYTLPGGALVVQPVPSEEYQASFVIPEAFAVADVDLTLHGLSTTGGGLVGLIVLLSYLPPGFDPANPGGPEDVSVVLMSSLSLASTGMPPPPSFVDGDFTFDDEAALPITAITPPAPEALALRLGGTFRPQDGALGALDGFSSSSIGGVVLPGGTFPTPGGVWLLTIRSVSNDVGATVGELEGATLTLTVPEPGAVAMTLAGFSVLGASRRRERRVSCA
jgi:hypothetical protein